MDIVLGLRIKGGVLVATSKAATRGISVIKVGDDKTRELNPNTLMAYTGEAGDTVQFAEYIMANTRLYGIRHDIELSPSAVASFTRNQLAKALRSRKPYQVNVLIAGFDPKTEKPTLNLIDYLASNVELPYAAHGYAAYYTMSLLDRHWKQDMTQEEGVELMRMCIKELQTRLPVDFKGVYVKVVDKDGIRDVSALVYPDEYPQAEVTEEMEVQQGEIAA